ncbi:WG repeat-containing protein [Brevibacillus ginsengisoli]|uniref:WG repeat-containing protein n=1 Tax=Brevibacillus ginsengisoli TaxID=363854 RepID=UPI003CF2E24F
MKSLKWSFAICFIMLAFLVESSFAANNQVGAQVIDRTALFPMYSHSQNKWGMVNLSGKLVIKPQYDNLIFPQNALPDFDTDKDIGQFYQGEKKGYINNQGKIIFTAPRGTRYLFFFHEGLRSVFMWGNYDGKSQWKAGFINKNGKMVIKPQFDRTTDFKNGVAPAEINDKFGLIDKSGKIITPIKYKSIKEYDGKYYIPISENFLLGLMDQNEKIVIPPKFVYLGDFSEGIAPAGLPGELRGYIDFTGKFIIEPKFFEPEQFENGIARVRERNANLKGFKYGFINKKGEWIAEPGTFGEKQEIYTWYNNPNIVQFFDDNYFLGAMNLKGEIISQPYIKVHRVLKNGLVIVSNRNNLFGIIDKNMKFVLPPVYKQLDEYNGLYSVDQTKGGYINLQGKLVIPPIK